jgi:prepilin peptidase CpaA
LYGTLKLCELVRQDTSEGNVGFSPALPLRSDCWKMQALATALLILVLVWSAGACDLRARRIPNLLVLVGIVGGCVWQLLLLGVDGLSSAAGGLLTGLALFLPGYLVGATGAGDVKLMGAVGTFLGASDAFFVGLASMVAGGVIALTFMLSALVLPGHLKTPWWRYGLMVRAALTTGRLMYIKPGEGEVMGRRFPYAISIAIGTTAFLGYKLLEFGVR